MLRPPPLRPGDRVAVVAPASPYDANRFARGMARLAERYAVAPHPSLGQRHRYLAGTDEVRAAALSEAFQDAGTHAVVAARGGSGAGRLLSRLDPGRLPSKALVGFSDVTVLHAFLQAQQRISIHGPVVTQLGEQPGWVLERLWALLEGRVPEPLTGTPLVDGVVEGPLLGGNLTVFTTLLGTRWLPDVRGAVLLLEDVNEPPYRLDRAWTHLRNAGVLGKLAGIALGHFVGCEPPDGGYTARDVLADLVRESGLPCLADLPVGHGDVNAPLGLGTRVRLDAGKGTLTMLEAATA